MQKQKPHWSYAGAVAPLVESFARRARSGRPRTQVDGDGLTQDDLVQDLAVAVWMVLQRKPDASRAYLVGTLNHKAADAQRRATRAAKAKAAAAWAPAGWWSSGRVLVDGEACLEAVVDLSRLAQHAITRAAEEAL